MATSTALKNADEATFYKIIDQRRRARMDRIDLMSKDLRELVHDYGLNVVNAFLESGVTKPNRIRHLVETVLNEFSPTRGSNSSQGIRNAKGM